MEKIKYVPLVNHISENLELYNQLYREYELKYNSIDYSLIIEWHTDIVEPLIKNVHAVNPERLPNVFKVLFTELLRLLGNRNAIVYESEYKSLWTIFNKNPELIGKSPQKLVKAINNAIETIRNHCPDKVNAWIFLMDKVVADCKTVDEFLGCGRIFAWMSGMAQLRSIAENEYRSLPDNLKYTINHNYYTNNLESAFQFKWSNLSSTDFVGETGGFVGFGGVFLSSPIVAIIEEQILVTDNTNSNILFADQFGKVFLSDISTSPDIIKKKANTIDLKTFRKLCGDSLIPFDDVSSCVLFEDTFVLTRQSSHYLYIYGITK